MLRRLIIILLLPAVLVTAQTDIKKQQRALEKLRAEIEMYEKKIRDREQQERATLEHLDDIEKQSNLVRAYLSELVNEESRIRQNIGSAEENIAYLEQQVENLKQHYAQYVSSVYKYGRVYDFETLLSAKSLNQLYIRIQYLRRFSEQRKKDITRIGFKKEQMVLEQLVLQDKLDEERKLIEEKKSEEKKLKVRKVRRTRVLTEIRNDKSNTQKELVRKTRAAKELENLIVDLIEKERIRKEQIAKREKERRERIERERKEKAEKEKLALRQREQELERLRKANELEKVRIKEREIEETKKRQAAEEREYAELAAPKPSEEPFEERKGKLRWPVKRGSVVAQFGNHVHPVLKTVTQNTGIDVAVPPGTPIHTIADGDVALIHWLPSYGNLVIINHNNGFRTVYAHLAEITVNVGQELREGDVLGTSGESVSGNVMHFELWKEKEKQNPELWLAKRR